MKKLHSKEKIQHQTSMIEEQHSANNIVTLVVATTFVIVFICIGFEITT